MQGIEPVGSLSDRLYTFPATFSVLPRHRHHGSAPRHMVPEPSRGARRLVTRDRYARTGVTDEADVTNEADFSCRPFSIVHNGCAMDQHGHPATPKRRRHLRRRRHRRRNRRRSSRCSKTTPMTPR